MVEREQGYEKQARRTELWLRIIGWMVAAAVLAAVIVGFILIGLNSKSAQIWVSITSSFTAGAAVVVAARPSIETPDQDPISFRHRDDEMSGDSHQDVR